MGLEGVRLGFAVTGSHCTLSKAVAEIERLVAAGVEVFPIVSPAVRSTDTRFGSAQAWYKRLCELTGKEPIETIVAAEPIGPKKLFDILVVAPCTGNSLAKLAGGITDTPALMAMKGQLRNQRPLVIAIATNDGLGMNARNIATLLNTKYVYFVPFGQDSPADKPCSLVAKTELLPETVQLALDGRQMQPVLVEYGN